MLLFHLPHGCVMHSLIEGFLYCLFYMKRVPNIQILINWYTVQSTLIELELL